MRWIRLLLGCLLVGLAVAPSAWARTGGPDAGGYIFADSNSGGSPYVYQHPSGVIALADDASSVVGLSFPFTFYGVSYTDLVIHSNGGLSFGDTSFVLGPSNPEVLTVNKPVIAPFWMDFNPESYLSDSVYGGIVGTAPNRVVLIEWRDIVRYNAVTTETGVTFLVKLFEADNHIEFHYTDTVFGNIDYDYGYWATVGITDGASTTLQYSGWSADIASGMAISFYPGGCTDSDSDGSCSRFDCDDSDAQRSPTFLEQSCNGVDDDCDAATVDSGDNDGDGYDGCAFPYDCDDTNAQVNPGASEVLCNGWDDDCDISTVDSEDLDGDGWSTCADDCDDGAFAVHPGATELCNGVDDDCDTTVDDGFDSDADGYTTCGGDCDDAADTVHPGATEICDGADDNCDGSVDEGFDVDGDGYTTCGGDCDDEDALRSPDEAELCDGVDNNCDGGVDEGFDVDGDGYTTCGGDCDDGRAGTYPGATETCDGIDSDCDGDLVDGFGDVDADGFPDCIDTDSDGDGFSGAGDDCDDTDASVYPGAAEQCDDVDSDCDGDLVDSYTDLDADGLPDCVDSDADGDGHEAGIDCDDADASVYPGATEACDLIDSDCDGDLVDGFDDLDADGTPDCAAVDTDGDGTPDGSDCAPGDPAIHPGAVEVPDDGIDQDCSGTDTVTCHLDGDSDGVGGTVTFEADDGDCDDSGEATSGGDCDDSDDSVYPGAPEPCDAVDNDCDGDLVEGYDDLDSDGTPDCADADADGDGHEAGADCDDADAAIHPGAVEECDAVDSDCDGSLVDEFPDQNSDGEPECVADADGDGDPDDTDCEPSLPSIHHGAEETPDDGVDQDCSGTDTVTCYHDGDGDGWGSGAALEPGGDCAAVGKVEDDGDCDDADPLRYPGAPELCDGVDNDCDGAIEQPSDVDFINWYQDLDGDGYGGLDSPHPDNPLCARPGDDWEVGAEDCDDSDAQVHPGAPELCNGIDDDCDGERPREEIDGDLDGFAACDGDCADADPSSYPGAEEDCADEADNNCDGAEEAVGEDPLCWAAPRTGCEASLAPGAGGLLGLLLLTPLLGRRRSGAAVALLALGWSGVALAGGRPATLIVQVQLPEEAAVKETPEVRVLLPDGTLREPGRRGADLLFDNLPGEVPLRLRLRGRGLEPLVRELPPLPYGDTETVLVEPQWVGFGKIRAGSFDMDALGVTLLPPDGLEVSLRPGQVAPSTAGLARVEVRGRYGEVQADVTVKPRQTTTFEPRPWTPTAAVIEGLPAGSHFRLFLEGRDDALLDRELSVDPSEGAIDEDTGVRLAPPLEVDSLIAGVGGLYLEHPVLGEGAADLELVPGGDNRVRFRWRALDGVPRVEAAYRRWLDQQPRGREVDESAVAVGLGLAIASGAASAVLWGLAFRSGDDMRAAQSDGVLAAAEARPDDLVTARAGYDSLRQRELGFMIGGVAGGGVAVIGAIISIGAGASGKLAEVDPSDWRPEELAVEP